MKWLYKLVLTVSCIIILIVSGTAQSYFFTNVSENSIPASTEKRDIIPGKYQTLKVDAVALHSFLWSLPDESLIHHNRDNAPVLILPMPDGRQARFHVWESCIQAPGLEMHFPEIKTFAGQGIDDPYATIRFDYSPYFGFRAQILSAATGRIYIDHYRRNDPGYCISYFHINNNRVSKFECLNDEMEMAARLSQINAPGSPLAATCRGTMLSTYRLAISCTGEYAVAVGGGQAGPTHSAIVTTINRVDGVYENELAIRLVLIANNNLIEYLNGATDPFVNVISGALLNSNQSNTDLVIGSTNYDIGHIFTSDDNGLAGLGVVCTSGKARGATGAPDLTGDGFDIDYVAHEMGHQFGAGHSFNSNTCASSGGSVEPGGGTTIMGYAGICAPTENIQPHSDAIFHALSYDQITAYITNSAGATCAANSPTGNTLPVITSTTNNNFTIPISTPFTLRGSATDSDGDALTYNWEGYNAGPEGSWPSAAGSTTRPLFRTRLSKTTGERTFPDIRVIVANYPGTSAPSVMDGLRGEVLPTVARSMKFRLTVRDNRAGGGGVVATGSGGCLDETAFQVSTSGAFPFKVTVPNGGESYTGGSQQTVTWNVSNTNNAPFNATNVKISISTDGGYTYPTVLIASTPNDGTELVTMPPVASTTARIKVEAVENIFFDISNNNFTLTAPTNGFTLGTPAPLNINCGSSSPAVITLTTAQIGTFSTPINLSASNVPSGTTVSFSPNPVAPGSSATVTLNNANTLSPGSYSIVVTGTAGALTQTTTLTYSVAGGSGPVITTQPTSATICLGTPVTFTAAASGSVSYQWQLNSGSGFNNISGETGPNFTIPTPLDNQNGHIFHVLVTGTCGVTTSNNATLTVQSPVQISTQPVNVGTCNGANATFSVVSAGTNLNYQWQVSSTGCGGTFSNMSGQNSSSLLLSAVSPAMSGSAYRVIITGDCGSPVTSNCATLTVSNAAAISSNPSATVICEGATASFTVTATGAVTSYQWQVNTGSGFSNISGATTATLTVPSVTPGMSGNQYQVLVYSCTATPISSTAATLTVNQLATISNQPAGSTLCEGVSNSFVVTAAGTGLSFQWQKSSACGGTFTDISGATSSTLTLTNIATADAGAYRVVVTGTCNSVTSNCATLTVNIPLVINTQPQDVEICLPTNTANFSVTVTGTGLNYQWQESTDGGTNYSNIPGATSASLTINNITASFNNKRYRVMVGGNCSTTSPSSAAKLLVNSTVNITTQPQVTISACDQGDASLSVVATGASLSYQWQNSTDGITFSNIGNTGIYTGATSATLHISPLSLLLNNQFYRVIVSGVPCGSETSTNSKLIVNGLPVVTLTASSNQPITPSSHITLSATATPAGNYIYHWYKSGVLDNTKSGSTITATVDDLGSWVAEAVMLPELCASRSNAIMVDFASSNNLFISPNPNKGAFFVRYFSTNLNTARTLTIYDSKGARVYQKAFTINAPYTGMNVNLYQASSGVYMVDLRDASGKRIATGKVLIE